jgi:hypothetical protein
MLRLPRSRGAVRAGGTALADLREGWTAFTSRRWVVLMVVSFATYQATVLPAIFVLGPVLSEEHLDGATSWALVLSARAIGALAAGLLLLRWRPRRPLVTASMMVLLDVPFLLSLAFGAPVAVVALTAVVSSAGVLGSDTVWESTLQANVPADVLSRVSSYDWFGSMLINPLGFALIGVVSHLVGATEVILVATALLVLVRVGLWFSPAIRGVSGRTALPDEDLAPTP